VWLKKAGGSMEVISQDDSTAQLDPLRFCRWLLARCLERSVQLHHPARAISVSKDEDGQLNYIRIRECDTESECRKLHLCYKRQIQLLTLNSILHTPRHHLRRLVSPHLHDSLSPSHDTNSYRPLSGSLASDQEPFLQSRRGRSMPRSVRH
jgi:hypothetical protein